MAKNSKLYAVRKGSKTGIFRTWSECEASVKGYPGAKYKSFTSMEEARAYLEEDVLDSLPGYPAQGDTLTAYVDGSYDDGLKVYAFGCVFLFFDGSMKTYIGNGREPDSLAMRNVAGEMLGAMYALQFALKNGYKHLELCYDYSGIEKWAVGEWKTNKELTKKYAAFMRRQSQFIEVTYHKVAAHSNQEFNELADQAAKRGLTQGNGIPAVELL